MCLQEFRSSCLLSEPLAGELLSTSGLSYSKSEARWTHKSFFASLFKKTPQWVPHCTATCALSTNIIQNTPVLYSKLKASCQMIVIPYIYESVGKKYPDDILLGRDSVVSDGHFPVHAVKNCVRLTMLTWRM